MSGIEYRYRFVETGVGCAEHADPTCLCDVVVTDPVPLSREPLYYEFADAIDERVGTPAWWQGILACHDLEHYGSQIADRNGLSGLEFGDRGQFLLDLTDESQSATAVAKKHGIHHQVTGHWRRVFDIVYAKARFSGKRRQNRTASGTVAA